jgi:hypothetical protein
VNFPEDADWKYRRNGYDNDVVPDTVEVWNISWLLQPPLPSGNSLDDAVRYWEGWLDRGEQVTATGGSDNHWVSLTALQGIGQPTTWTFVTERSERGVLEALRSGRTYISHQPPLHLGAGLVIEADRDGDGVYESVAGDTVPTGSQLRVRATNATGALLRVITTGGLQALTPVPVITPQFEYRFTVPSDATWARAELFEPDLAPERAALCDDLVGDQTTYCRDRLLVLAMTSALYLRQE